MPTIDVIVLMGPTGSGKTPLGALIHRDGLWGRRCAHFDFGQSLRNIVARRTHPGLTACQIDFLAEVLTSGALLEDEHQPVIETIFHEFVARQELPPDGLVALNGLPRHVAQAEAIDTMVAVQTVVELRCTPEVITARIENNAGGDRTGRLDDTAADVERKLRIYHQRTMTVIDYYQRRGVRILRLDVDVVSTAEDMFAALEACRQKG